eukprot:CAMPEP_0203919042 /NCGR_PEP_ID=MMETSP0359-20131031/59530_1 /ASSEMBLY_ACC=CAM_ASM_000338 /TAXON_ID=268821 /ORGANISM="Scrippsiella Hangoei, Strain SHTV-5" /LENGTH=130 /DNA_ID=CAMNT_0050846255 /DNA_START=544 /DNA_END=937 /DNA_ORIENTATION=+
MSKGAPGGDDAPNAGNAQQQDPSARSATPSCQPLATSKRAWKEDPHVAPNQFLAHRCKSTEVCVAMDVLCRVPSTASTLQMPLRDQCLTQAHTHRPTPLQPQMTSPPHHMAKHSGTMLQPFDEHESVVLL